MRTLNLGILAHVDAGKTSLTERLLYAAGVIGEIGSVDQGSTQTDSMALERQRGITIRSAVVSFRLGDATVNLIDTPGHPDFIAEVERVLTVLDGAVLVVSAVEGVQPQTRILMRALRRIDIPALIFINKIDRGGADPRRVLANLGDKLTPRVIAMGATAGEGTRAASFTPFGPGDPSFTSAMAELLADTDDELLAAYVNGTPPPYRRLRAELASQARRAAVYPVLAGSAITGAGIGELSACVTEFLPASTGDPAGPPAGTVFKIDRGPGGEKIAYVRMTSGILRPRTALHTALAQLAEQDPLINLRRAGQEIFISLYGEVQKEVIEATLADEFGIAVTFRETTTICVERPAGIGESVERIAVPPNPFLAGVGLRVEPATSAERVVFRLGVEAGAMPPAFFTAVEETVRETLEQGIFGWQVTGCLVTMTHSGYWPRQSHAHGKFDKSMSSTAGDFRCLTPLVVMDALSRAGTDVFEPLHRFLLDVPAERSAVTVQALPRLDAVPLDTVTRGSAFQIEGEIPAARIRDLERELPGLTGGEGVLETAFDRYRRVRGAIPSRPRTDANPLNRKEYLIHVVRRV